MFLFELMRFSQPMLLPIFFVVVINCYNNSGHQPDYASGAEDGYVRLHFFDKSYLDMKDPVPEADESMDGEEEMDDGDKNPQANQ
jgi:hypothetical protein